MRGVYRCAFLALPRRRRSATTWPTEAPMPRAAARPLEETREQDADGSRSCRSRCSSWRLPGRTSRRGDRETGSEPSESQRSAGHRRDDPRSHLRGRRDRASTDPAYPPQSSSTRRRRVRGLRHRRRQRDRRALGVEVEFTDAELRRGRRGGVGGRWDISVGSVTITDRSARGPRLHRSRTTSRRPRWRVLVDSDIQSPRGPRRRDGLRRRGRRPTCSGSRAR